MTTNVPRGANRPYVTGKRAKASQSNILPPKSDAQKAAHDAEIAAARLELAARAAERQTRVDTIKRSTSWGAAQSFITIAEQHGWCGTGCVTSFSGGLLKVTAIVTRGDERLALSWESGTPTGYPLLTQAGHNYRLASPAVALEAIYAAPRPLT